MSKPRRPTFSTPPGYARFPHLNTPDTRFNAAGDYKADLRVKAEDAQHFIAYLEKLRDEFEATIEKKPKHEYVPSDVFTIEFDDEGSETGYVIFKTKLPAVGKNNKTGETWKQQPQLYDSMGNEMPPDVQIWSGTRMIVAGTVNCYAFTKDKDRKTGVTKVEVGVSLKCRGVQVLELVSNNTAPSAAAFGFKPQVGGYIAGPAAAGIGKPNVTSGGDDDEASAEDGDEEF